MSVTATSYPNAPVREEDKARFPMVRFMRNWFGVEYRIWRQRDMIQKKDFDVIGKLLAIVFEPSGMELPALGHPVFHQNRLEWRNEPGSGMILPTLAVSKSGFDVLLPDYRLPELPMLRDPGTIQNPNIPPVDRPQLYSERTILQHRNFKIIQPIKQLLIQTTGARDLKIASALSDGDTQPAFLIDPHAQKAFFVGGVFVI